MGELIVIWIDKAADTLVSEEEHIKNIKGKVNIEILTADLSF
jgi:hypothetical protein